ncbi:MAG: M48 family metalloprotease [Rhodoferax sp.]|nr:M48 family metalloprotease [Rhodoferax sp.]
MYPTPTERPARRISCIALFLATLLHSLPAVAQGNAAPRNIASSTLPHLGDDSAMTPGAERRLGDRIIRELYKDPDYIDDAVLMEYVQSIWQPLLAAARLKGELPSELDEAYAWEILLSRDKSVNAFALPGAYFGLHLGLVGIVANKDELASVMGHELSHVTQRHISRMMSRQSAQTPWLIGAMILGILAASKSPDGANAMIVGGQAAAAQSQLNFSRDMEREADRIGFGVMTQAGFDPEGFVTMFSKLQQASRLNDNGGFPYLRSHPLSTERMADMQGRVPQNNGAAGLGTTATVQSLDHAMIAARARVLSNTAIDALRSWAIDADPARAPGMRPAVLAGALYGATLASLKMRDFDTAHASWVRLDLLTQSDPAAARIARILGAELALARGNPARALELLPPDPSNSSRATFILRRLAQLDANQAAKASDALQIWVTDHPRDAQAWQLLARAYAAQGRVLASIRAEAEASLAHLDYAGAISRLKAAQDIARKGVQGAEHMEASIVDTRARHVESLLREQLLER